MEADNSRQKQFVPTTLPWVVAAVALVFYLATLNHWVSLASLFPVARLAHWIWQPELNGPLYWLVTLPFRVLPAKVLPLALNGFSAICATLTLALLARSVALLPHDRTEEERTRERSPYSTLSIRTAWLPVVLAVGLCGLQLTFWEHATAASSEIFDLLLFAYILRCLMEFRMEEKDSWLWRACLVYGLAMTDNWAMAGFFPVFVVALVWLKGVNFFNARFLGRAFLLALAGLSLYLLLPLVNALSPSSPVSFWQALKANLGNQKWLLFNVIYNKELLLHGDPPLWVLALPSLMPMLALAIRWPSYFGDPSKLGVALTTLMFHVLNAVLMLVCCWVCLDPEKFSPRHYPQLVFYGVLGLPFYYLAALSVGYYTGYFLLVFGTRPLPRGRAVPRPVPAGLRLINLMVTGSVWAVAAVALVTLVHRNLPQVRLTNGPMLRQYTTAVLNALPPKGAVLLSDDTRRLALLEGALAQASKAKDYLLLDTAYLPYPDYHRVLNQKYPHRWPSHPERERKEQFDPSNLQALLLNLSRSNQVFYLHPSFGYFFEVFYPVAHGLVYELKPYESKQLLPPPPSGQLIAENEAFWKQLDTEALEPLEAALAPPPVGLRPSGWESFLKELHLSKETNPEALLLGSYYSRAADFWGVEMQRHDQVQAAERHFTRALALNPDNRVAEANLDCNHALQAHQKIPPRDAKYVEDLFGRYSSWDGILAADGPYDEPNFCYPQGVVFAQHGHLRQAAQVFTRARAMAPELLPARLWLAQICLTLQLPDEALQVIEGIHADAHLLGLSRTNVTDLLSVEASAHLLKNDAPGADKVVANLLKDYPANEDLLATATEVYMKYGRFTNALATIEEQLKIRPDNPTALINEGYSCLQLNAYERAIGPLSRVVSMETTNFSELHYNALFNRAIAYLRSDKLEESQQDYEVLQKTFPTAFKVAYGLGEIAFRKKDTNAAVRNYQLYLENAPTNTAEAALIRTRLKELKGSAS